MTRALHTLAALAFALVIATQCGCGASPKRTACDLTAAACAACEMARDRYCSDPPDPETVGGDCAE